MRAIEIRTMGTKQTAEPMRLQAVDDAVKQGYILTRYFYTSLLAFEKDPAGLRNMYSDILERDRREAAGEGGERGAVRASNGAGTGAACRGSRIAGC